MDEETLGRLQALIEADPAAAAKLLQGVKRYVMVPHEKQAVVLDHQARFKILNAGRRFGKTMVGAKAIATRARKQHQVIWWVAPTYKIVKRGYREVLRQIPPEMLSAPAPPDTNFDAGRSVILKLKNGTVIEFYSATMPEGMLGASVDFVVLDEASKMSPRIWQQIVSPTLMDRLGEALMISTPSGMNWFFLEYNKGQDPENTDYASWTFTSEDNPYLPLGEVERMAEDMPLVEADQEIYAKFLSAGSSVFMVPEKAKQQARVVDGRVQDVGVAQEQVVVGIDLAKTRDFTVLYGARASDRRNCWFERFNSVSWAEQKRRIHRCVRQLMADGAENVMLVIDSTGVGDPILEDLEMQGYDVIGVNFSGQNKPNMVKLLAKDLEKAHAFVLDNEFVDLEFRAYTMSVTPGGRYTYAAPEGMWDDVVSAKMLQHHGVVNEGVGNVEMLTPAADLGVVEADPSGDPEEEFDPWDDLLDDDPIPYNAEAGVPGHVVEPPRQDPLLELQRRQPTLQELLSQGFF
jgi:hypothetical protein